MTTARPAFELQSPYIYMGIYTFILHYDMLNTVKVRFTLNYVVLIRCRRVCVLSVTNHVTNLNVSHFSFQSSSSCCYRSVTITG